MSRLGGRFAFGPSHWLCQFSWCRNGVIAWLASNESPLSLAACSSGQVDSVAASFILAALVVALYSLGSVFAHLLRHLCIGKIPGLCDPVPLSASRLFVEFPFCAAGRLHHFSLCLLVRLASMPIDVPMGWLLLLVQAILRPRFSDAKCIKKPRLFWAGSECNRASLLLS
jgi:hypothetical protein